ncbi:MAG: hypothetical protein LKM45_00980 [Wolbachia endosymbiont of Alcedoecus sp.]|nr:hypothetical protein [Wolbachia endosymbiont of Alcedoecus sp.]
MPSTLKLNRALVDAFNVHNFGSNVDTNFLAEGSDIVVRFGGNKISCQEYLEFMGEEVRKEHFASKKDSGLIFDLNSFPFKFNKGRWQQDKGDKEKGIVKFVIPASPAVILNLQYHFTIERTGIIAKRMIRELVYNGYDKEEARAYVSESITYNKVKMRKRFTNKDYLCISFDNEGFMNNFIQKYKEDMEWSDDDFLKRWEVNGLHMYEKNIYEKDIRLRDIELATRKARELIGRFFDTSSSEDESVKRYKNAITDLIFRETGIPIFRYHHDTFVSQSRINNGEYFAFIPEVQEESIGETYLTREEAGEINKAFGFALLNNVEGQTKETESCKSNGVYALTNKQIAYLIPGIIRESSMTKIGDSYGLAIDYDILRSPLPSNPASPIHESEPSGSGIKTQTPLTSSQRKELYSVLSPEMKKKFKSLGSPSDMENLLYLLYVNKREVRVLLTPEKEEIWQLQLSQLAAGHPLVGESGNRNSQAFSSSGYESESSPGSSPGSSLDSVDIAKFIQHLEKKGDRVY